MENRKLHQEAKQLQQSSENNNMTQIWNYAKKIRAKHMAKHQPIKRKQVKL